MNIETLNISFNRITADGLLHILGDNFGVRTMSSLALSGNTLSPEVVKKIASYLGKNNALKELYLDQMNMDQDSERNIALAIAVNKKSALSVFTGFSLGPHLSELKIDDALYCMSNEQVLKHLWCSSTDTKDTVVAMSRNPSFSNFHSFVAEILPPEVFRETGFLSGFPSTTSFLLSEEEISLLLSDADPFDYSGGASSSMIIKDYGQDSSLPNKTNREDGSSISV
jgi:hypothetical protein